MAFGLVLFRKHTWHNGIWCLSGFYFVLTFSFLLCNDKALLLFLFFFFLLSFYYCTLLLLCQICLLFCYYCCYCFLYYFQYGFFSIKFIENNFSNVQYIFSFPISTLWKYTRHVLLLDCQLCYRFQKMEWTDETTTFDPRLRRLILFSFSEYSLYFTGFH